MSERNPRYPASSLRDVLASVEKIYKDAGRSVLDPEALVKILGYTGMNGASRSVLAALNGYGAIIKEGSGYKVSEEAIGAIRPMDEADRLRHVRQMALAPSLFSEINTSHKDCTEGVLATVLVRKGFTDDGARKAAKIWKDNFELARLGESGYTEDKPSAKPENGESDGLKEAEKPPKSNKNEDMDLAIKPDELPIPIAGRIARIPFPMTADDFELFIGTLQLWKKKLVRTPSAIPAKVTLPATATWSNGDNDKPVKIVALMGEKDGELYYRSEDGTGIPASQLKF